MKGALHIDVARSADEVFDFLADIRNERSWNPRIVTIEKVSEGPISAGTKFRGIYAGIGELTTELVVFERPRRFSFRSTGPRMHIEGQFVLAPSPAGTTIDLEAELAPQSFFRLLAPLMAPIIRKQNEAAGERLKRVLSANPPANASSNEGKLSTGRQKPTNGGSSA
jgi:hypothetical protein